MAGSQRGKGSGSGHGDGGSGGARPRIHSSHQSAGHGPGQGARDKRRGDGPRGKGPALPKPTRPKNDARGTAVGASKAGPRTKKGPAPKGLPKGAAKGITKAGAEGPSVASDQARRLAIEIAIAALEKKAVGLEILDVAGKVDYADFLVLMTGRSDRQVIALAQGIEETLRKKDRRPISVEGLPHASWVLMDFGDVVVHVFQDDARGLYDLEGLWMDARRLPLPPPSPEELR